MAPPPRVKRQPDAGVATAVAQIVKHRKFKRMMMFGLRSLSELTTPPTIKFKENAICSLEEGAIAAIVDVIQTDATDEEVAALACKVFWGLTEGLKEDPQEALLEKFVGDGASDAALAMLTAGVKDDSTMELLLGCFQNLAALNVAVNPTPLVAGLVNSLESKMKPKLAEKLLASLASICAANPSAAVAFAEKGGAEKVLKALLVKPAPNDRAALAMADSGLRAVQAAAITGKCGPQTLELTMKVLDAYKSKRALEEIGSSAMAAMMGPEQMRACLTSLSTSKEGSPERRSALTMLTSMSYIGSYADAIVKAGSLPLLCNAVERSGVELSSSDDESLLRGLTGACKMLGRIASSVKNTEAVRKAGGQKAAISAFKSVESKAAGSAAVCVALAPLAQIEAFALEMLQAGTLAGIFNAIAKLNYDLDLVKAGLGVVASGACHPTVAEAYHNLNPYQIISQCMQKDIKDETLQLDCVATLSLMAPTLQSIEVLSVSKVLDGVVQSLAAHPKNEGLAEAGARFYKALSKHPHASTLNDGTAAGSIMGIMLSHATNKGICDDCLTALEEFATEKDVSNNLAGLEAALMAARMDSARAFTALAAVGGLSKIVRLRPIIEAQNAAEVVLKAMESWVAAPKFNDQQRVIAGGAQCIKSVKELSGLPLEATMNSLLHLALHSAFKQILERQEPQDNNLLDVLKAVEALAAKNNVTDEAAVTTVVESVMKVMRKYPDIRKVQVSCLTTLAELMQSPGGPKALQESGALKLVLNYMLKVAIYEDVQIAGFRLLSIALDKDASLIESTRRNGGLEVVKSATRTHGKSKEVKLYLLPVATLLTPDDELDRQIVENGRRLVEAHGKADISMVLMGSRNLNQLTVSQAGSRCAAKCNIGDYLHTGLAVCVTIRKKASPPAETFDAFCEIAAIYRNVAETRMGCVNLLANAGIDNVSNLMEQLEGYPDSEAKKSGLAACCQTLQRLVRADRFAACETMAKKSVTPRAFRLCEAYPDDPELFGSAAELICSVRGPSQKSILPQLSTFIAQLIDKIENSPDKNLRLSCIKALEEAMIDPDMSTIDIMSRNKLSKALLKAMDDFVDDAQALKRAQKLMEDLGRHRNLREEHLQSGGMGAIAASVKITRRAIRQHKADPLVCTTAIKLLNQSTSKLDKDVLNESGIMAEVQELMLLHPGNKALMVVVGQLLDNLGAGEMIPLLMQQIIDLVQKKPEGWGKNLEGLLNKLALVIASEVDDPKRIFALTDKCMDCLADAILKKGLPAPALAASVAVARRLVDRFVDSPNDIAFGAKSVASKMMPAIVQVLAGTDVGPKAKRDKDLLCNSFECLAGCLQNPNTRMATIDQCRKNGILAKAFELLDIYANDAEVTAKVLNFLAKFGLDAEGADLLSATCRTRPKGRNLPADLDALISALMLKHRKDTGVVGAGMELIGNLLGNSSKPPQPMVTSEYLAHLESLADGADNGLAALCKTLPRFIGKLETEELGTSMKRCMEKWSRFEADELIGEDVKVQTSCALAEMIADCAAQGLLDDVKKAGGVETLHQILEQHPNDLAAVMAVTKALRAIADLDADVNVKVARNTANFLLENCLPAAEKNPEAVGEIAALMKVLCKQPGNASYLATTQNFNNFVDSLEQMQADQVDTDGHNFGVDAQQLRKAVEDDKPHILTLEEVHGKWSARLEAGESLDMEESPIVLQNFDFVFDYTEEYSKEQLKDLTSTLGREFMFGCQCFQLLHKYEGNSKICVERKEQTIFLPAMKRQKNEHVAQCAVLAAVDACQYPPLVKAFQEAPEAALIAASSLQRGRKIVGTSEDVEAMLIPRLILIERLATERKYFNNTEAMSAIIGLWDDYDEGRYSTMLLRHVFRSMRQIVNDHFVPIILEKDVPRRLIAVVDDTAADLELLPDVLFLLGSLAVVPQIKTMIGDLKGIEACLDLLKRCLKNPANTSRVQTNSCLALANITIGHGANTSKFTAAKGQDLNVTVMNESMAKRIDYDVANGASILMCNTCFKRDDQKELYGKKRGPEAVMHTIKKYDGSADKSAIRCLTSMFKAIGNLALCPSNVTDFLNHGIEKTFVHFYLNAGNLPDPLIETSLRTVSNLVLENTEAAMIKFGEILIPLLQMLQKGGRDTVSMLSMAFETLGCLCRLPENAKAFAANQGIQTVLKILNSECDEALYGNGIYVLGIQTTNPASIDILIDNGAFGFLVALLEQQLAKTRDSSSTKTAPDSKGCMATELVVSGLRCIRRLLQTKRSGDEFISAGGLTATANVIGRTDEHSIIHLECYRIIIALLELNPPPQPPPPPPTISKVAAAERDWDGEVEDEGVLPPCELLDRPPSPRSWEAIGLDPSQISEMIVSISGMIAKEENLKQIRLARCGLGLLAYFACEKVADTLESFFNGGVCKAIEVLIESFEGDNEIVLSACYVLNNIAVVSDPSLYLLLRKEKKMRSNLDYAIRSVQKSEKQTKDFVTLTSKLLNEKTNDPQRFEAHCQWTYPLSLTMWDKDAYPNGVQDLPLDMREEIRAGSRLRVQLDEKTRENFVWKSSFDMVLFTWRIEPKDGPVTSFSSTVSRIKGVTKGFGNAQFEAAAAQSSGINKLNEGQCCTLSVLPSQTLLEGAELNIVCKGKKERDRFVALLTEWRDAATYGF